MNPKAAIALDRTVLYLLLNRDSIHKIYLNGHADQVADSTYNHSLSLNRATEVKEYLASKGINNALLKVDHRGQLQPVDSFWTIDGRYRNRRVEISVIILNKL